MIPPTTTPMMTAKTTGTPAKTARLPITSELRTRIAPTDRSMPAVRMISVWANATKPVTVTCFSTVDSAPMPRKRGAMMLKAAMDRNRTRAGIMVGLRRRKLRRRWMKVLSSFSKLATAVSALFRLAS